MLGHSFPTVLVRNVRDAESGELLADHLWFNRGNIWRHIGPRPGDRVQFIARAVEYRTGYWGPNRLVRADNPPARRVQADASRGADDHRAPPAVEGRAATVRI